MTFGLIERRHPRVLDEDAGTILVRTVTRRSLADPLASDVWGVGVISVEDVRERLRTPVANEGMCDNPRPCRT